MSKMLLTTTSPFQKKLLQTAKGRRRPLCKALTRGEVHRECGAKAIQPCQALVLLSQKVAG